MMVPGRLNWRAAALGVVAVIFVLVAGGLLFIWSGIYNVAASKPHLALTRWILETTLRRSVETHSFRTTVPPLEDPDLVRLGAGHFAGGCAPCHGAPGQPRNPIVRSMLPHPPPLSQAARKWSPEELFWIVENGFKYTGMPAWPARGRADEVWAVVAFLRKLPEFGPREYRELAAGHASTRDTGGSDSAPGTAICARCHDTPGAAPVSRFAPRLAGQPEAYLRRALEEYAAGRRESGMMQAVAGDLAAADIGRLAAYYSGLSPASGSSAPTSEEAVARGSGIARQGIPSRGIPPCLACHSGRASETFPLLAGQSAGYLAGQLRLWQRGLRAQTAHGAIMSVIARRLKDEDIRNVAAYFEAASPDGPDRAAEGATGSTRP